MRLFVALEIPAPVRDNLAELIRELRALSSQAVDKRPRWVRPENLHVTLKFIGETPPPKLEGIRGTLLKIRSGTPVKIHFRGLGFFPSDKRPRVFWARVQASGNLALLAGDVDRALATQGIAQETRTFAPHLTLCRFEPPGMNETLRVAIEKQTAREFGSFETREFHLIESKTKSSGAEYTRVATFSFVTES